MTISPQNCDKVTQTRVEFESLPVEIIPCICSRLRGIDLRVCCQVSKILHQYATEELNRRFSKNFLSRKFGKKYWKLYFNLSVNEPKIPKKIIRISKKPSALFQNKLIFQTHSLLLIPEITVQLLVSKISNKNTKPLINESICKQINKTTPVKKNYWVLITNDLIGTDLKEDKVDLFNRLSHLNYKAPSLIESISYLIFKKTLTDKKERNLSTYTETELKNGFHIKVTQKNENTIFIDSDINFDPLKIPLGIFPVKKL